MNAAHCHQQLTFACASSLAEHLRDFVLWYSGPHWTCSTDSQKFQFVVVSLPLQEACEHQQMYPSLDRAFLGTFY